MLHSQMAGAEDNDGAFDFVVAKLRRGTEPPPHIHSREHEFMYLLSGEIRFYVEAEVFTVKSGECIFIPRGKRHAFLLTSEEAQNILLVTPGGFYDAFKKMSGPAARMVIPTDADVETYSTADLAETIKLFGQYGTRFLTRVQSLKQFVDVDGTLASTIRYPLKKVEHRNLCIWPFNHCYKKGEGLRATGLGSGK